MIVRGALSSKARSELEIALQWQLDVAGLGARYQCEVEFAKPERKWRVDFWFPEGLAVECEGGTWAMGRHNRGTGFEQDCEKYAAIAIKGFRLIRVTKGQIESGQALKWIEAALKPRS